MAHLPVRIRILAGVVVACLGMALVAAIGLTQMAHLRTGEQVLNTQAVAPSVRLDELRRAYLQTRIDALADEWIADTNGVEHAAFLADITAMDAAIAAAASSDRTQAAVVNDMDAAWKGYQQVVAGDAFLQLARSGNKAAYIAARNEKVKPVATRIQKDLDLLFLRVTQQTKARLAAGRTGYDSARVLLLAFFLVALAIAAVLGLVATRSVTGPLHRLRDVCQGVAEGDLTLITGLASRDELGQVAEALDRATAATRETVLALAGASRSMAVATSDLTTSAGAISDSAHETSARVESATTAAGEVSENVQAVAAAAEQMAASINEIARNTSEAAELGADTHDLSRETTTTMAKLSDSSVQIGNVIKVITGIAEQTNLLALNATIEAARAGDAGKGFAVVASEVKDLAQETARATAEIGLRVEAIQSDSASAVEAIDRITERISRLGDIQSSIAGAVEEQTATTAEMSRSVVEASSRTSLIADNMAGVNDAATETAGGAERTRGATGNLVQMCAELDNLVRKFRYQ